MFESPFIKRKTSNGGKYVSFDSSRYGRKRSRQESSKKWRTSGSWNTVERVMETLDQSFCHVGCADFKSARPPRTASESSSSCTSGAAGPMVGVDITCSYELINHSRQRWSSRLSPLQRSQELDEIACQHAKVMANSGMVFHSNPTELCESLSSVSMCRLGENVISGRSSLDMHMKMLERMTNYTNMIDQRYTEVGIANVRSPGREEVYYLCVLFRG